jgi:hypothetical protein
METLTNETYARHLMILCFHPIRTLALAKGGVWTTQDARAFVLQRRAVYFSVPEKSPIVIASAPCYKIGHFNVVWRLMRSSLQRGRFRSAFQEITAELDGTSRYEIGHPGAVLTASEGLFEGRL